MSPNARNSGIPTASAAQLALTIRDDRLLDMRAPTLSQLHLHVDANNQRR
ncbi:MAG: hypothetical protein IPM54_15340 [Polyangiaceae bacterium]|nr:hypothetical protein [Polyangiaceae bacterium]